MYEELIKRLRNCTSDTVEDCAGCPYQGGYKGTYCMNGLIEEAADVIEEEDMNFRHLERDYKELCAYLPKWIPVTERLPEDRQSVLVHRDDGGIFIFDYFTTSPTDECWIDDHLNVYSAYCVTHWMPLPEPPKEM